MEPPQPGIEPVTPAGEAQHLKHWTVREVWIACVLCHLIITMIMSGVVLLFSFYIWGHWDLREDLVE